MPNQPELPAPAHSDIDSMLSRKFGKEVANYFSGGFNYLCGYLAGESLSNIGCDYASS